MIVSLLTHPVSAFVAGLLVAGISVGLLLKFNAPPNRSADEVADYQRALDLAAASTFEGDESLATQRFTDFLRNIDDAAYLRKHTTQTYAPDAYLDDTLVVHRGAAEIEAYFLQTSATMTRYKLQVNDVASSGLDYYFRWTMTFAAPALSGGSEVQSVGMSQVRFNSEGKVAFHRDFWDSGRNFFAHLPVAGSVIGFIHKKLEGPGKEDR